MGFITKRQWSPDKKPRYSIHFKDQSGKWVEEATGVRKKNTDRLLVRREWEVADGTYGREEILFSEFYGGWIKGKKNRLKKSTYVSYEHTFRNHILPFFGDIPLSEIDRDKVQAWANEMSHKKLAPATVQRAFRYLRACLLTAVIGDKIRKNPCLKIDLARVERGELFFLEPCDVPVLIEHSREQESDLMAILGYAGLRLGEGLALAGRHVDLDRRTLTVARAYEYHAGIQDTKTGSPRSVPILPALEKILLERFSRHGRPGPDELLFGHDGKTPLDPSNVRKQFKKARDHSGLKPVTIHSLRHTFASALIASGASIKAVQVCLGHKSVVVTLDLYAHLLPVDLGSRMTEINKLYHPNGNGQDPDLEGENT